jgi:hypothetical protein
MLLEAGKDLDEISKDSMNSVQNIGKLYMWGWIGDGIKSSGSFKDKKAVIEILRGIPQEQKHNFHCGFHMCEICNEYNERSTFNGSVYIEYKGKSYCCPNGVEHYIEQHNYKPPKEVIEAIKYGDVLTKEKSFYHFYNLNKRKIEKEIKNVKKKKEEQRIAYEEREKTIKRIEKNRTPEQKSILKRFKDGELDLI